MQDHATKWSCDFMAKNSQGKSSSCQVRSLYRHYSSRNVRVLVCHMISKNHVIKRSCDLMGRSLLCHQNAKFGGHSYCGNGDIEISANTVNLPQMRDIRDCICPLTSKFIIFLKAHGMSYATSALYNNLRNNFYGNLFYCVIMWNKSSETNPVLVTWFLGNE